MYRPPPSCPNCGAVVYRTHKCRFSRGLPNVPPPLVVMPADFRARLDAELTGWREHRARPQPEQGTLL